MVLVHGGAAAGGQQHRLGLDEDEIAGPHVDHQNAGDGVALGGLDDLDRAMVLEPADVARPDLLGQAVDDLDAGEVALVHGAIEGLSGEGLLVHGAVGRPVEEAAELGLQLADADLRPFHQGPGQVLVVEPLAALDGVHEVALDGITRRQGDVVAALDHAGASRLAEEALDADGDGQPGRRLVDVQRGEQAGAAAAEDEDVGFDGSHCSTPNAVSAAARRSRARSATSS